MSATAETMIRDLSARGVRLSRNGENLRIVAPRGTLTPELRQTLTEAKPAILAALTTGELRAKLESLAFAEGVGTVIVRELPTAGLEACAELSDDVLRAYVRALRDSDLRERGSVPSHETAAIRCMHCGPVYAAPEVARVLPVVRNLPTAAGCPWCHVRARHNIPRPRISIGTGR
ncbi:hypothetical protein [Dokdonella fugitiva]|jgi:hypothetical protein|uniref:TubC N-terminal docking domain-containing protein n=1 Tax=Dokdonella fugitiva TaxID=328517 RepID=A0A4R2IAS4_9GAMM|nr:hypothetical protein [Dokdonella fugitiva]TCO41186.1 hypothetical protein EV148_103106 [Dokdonella fugitiva]